MINIVMVEPEIPANTGNVARTCAVTGAKLHLVKPLGFDIDDTKLKRAGLDYWDKLDVQIHENLDEFLEKFKNKEMYFASTKSKKIYSDVKYFSDEDKLNNYEKDIFILFGKETKGLPENLLQKNYENCIRIPMKQNLRSLNLSNSVNIILYEILRQIDFYNLEQESKYFEKE